MIQKKKKKKKKKKKHRDVITTPACSVRVMVYMQGWRASNDVRMSVVRSRWWFVYANTRHYHCTEQIDIRFSHDANDG